MPAFLQIPFTWYAVPELSSEVVLYLSYLDPFLFCNNTHTLLTDKLTLKKIVFRAVLENKRKSE
jgi:hypothetical protein